MGGGNLPGEIVQAISLSNAKAIGEQPAILSNLALATQILNQNMQQQMMLALEQAIGQITLATAAKCIALITGSEQTKSGTEGTEAAVKALKELGQLAEQIAKQFKSMAPAPPPADSAPPPTRAGPGGGGKKP